MTIPDDEYVYIYILYSSPGGGGTSHAECRITPNPNQTENKVIHLDGTAFFFLKEPIPATGTDWSSISISTRARQPKQKKRPEERKTSRARSGEKKKKDFENSNSFFGDEHGEMLHPIYNQIDLCKYILLDFLWFLIRYSKDGYSWPYGENLSFLFSD